MTGRRQAGDPAAAGAAERKAELRLRVQAWRRAVADSDLRRWSDALEMHLLGWAALRDARVVLAFRSLRREPRTEGLVRRLADRGVAVALPLVSGPDLLPRAAPDDPGRMGADGGGVLAGAEAVPAETLDAVLVPGLAFDRAGGRLGRGGGHYDRFLTRVRSDCLRVGLCFEGQIVPSVPTDGWDQAVDAVATEAGIWEVARRAGGA